MDKAIVQDAVKLINGWIDPKYLPEGKTKYYLRDSQVKVPAGGWRHLKSSEIEQLVKNNNFAASWDTFYVTDEFDPSMLSGNKFYGTVRIGRVSRRGLQFHDLRLPVGISNSSIHSCDIGDDCAIHDVHYLSHYIIGDRCMLFNIQEMCTTDHAKFGNGVVKDGEPESVRVWIDLMNETGSRKVCPFDGMIAADAYMWAKYIDDAPLQKKLLEITQKSIDSHRGYYGTIGCGCVIKNSSILKDVRIGESCYIKGASKLKNITINSSESEPSQIGENVILVNGIVGYGCKIFYSCTAVKFVIGNNCNLKYGARLINSLMGDNSTISCCEVLNNLIFPAHEQHHNNSFLVASVLLGQTNLAAGATLGSNHNSRTNDNELVAGRGFWPGLCTSVKHSSVFASYCLLAKADYPAELNVPLPFALVSNNSSGDRLEIMPAFWWLHDMYALARNSWKYSARDKRETEVQHIEFDTFAPDSMEEVLKAMALLERWTGESAGKTGADAAAYGKKLLSGPEADMRGLDVYARGIEKSKRDCLIRNPREAYEAYRQMIVHYVTRTLLTWMESHPEASPVSLSGAKCEHDWVNLGGQLMKSGDFDRLRSDIRQGRLSDWASIHGRYDEIWERYQEDKLQHAVSTCESVFGKLDAEGWKKLLNEGIAVEKLVAERVRLSRAKDYENPFRKATYRNEDEMIASVGRLDDNEFIASTEELTKKNIEKINVLISKL